MDDGGRAFAFVVGALRLPTLQRMSHRFVGQVSAAHLPKLPQPLKPQP